MSWLVYELAYELAYELVYDDVSWLGLVCELVYELAYELVYELESEYGSLVAQTPFPKLPSVHLFVLYKTTISGSALSFCRSALSLGSPFALVEKV